MRALDTSGTLFNVILYMYTQHGQHQSTYHTGLPSALNTPMHVCHQCMAHLNWSVYHIYIYIYKEEFVISAWHTSTDKHFIYMQTKRNLSSVHGTPQLISISYTGLLKIFDLMAQLRSAPRLLWHIFTPIKEFYGTNTHTHTNTFRTPNKQHFGFAIYLKKKKKTPSLWEIVKCFGKKCSVNQKWLHKIK